MFLLDTNALNLYVAGEPNTVRRVREHGEAVYISSVAAEELLSGCLGAINRARSPRTSLSLPRAHEDFAAALMAVQAFPIFVYSEEAEWVFRTFSPATLRIGPQDCRIAAQAMAHEMTVITRNLRDFEAIGARCDDWSAAL